MSTKVKKQGRAANLTVDIGVVDERPQFERSVDARRHNHGRRVICVRLRDVTGGVVGRWEGRAKPDRLHPLAVRQAHRCVQLISGSRATIANNGKI